jgi:DNA-binding MarR family transcriptional regulator
MTLKGSCLLVYNYLLRQMQPCTISNLDLAFQIGYDPRTINRAVARLRAAGLVRAWRNGKRRPMTYEVKQ